MSGYLYILTGMGLVDIKSFPNIYILIFSLTHDFMIISLR